MLTLLGLGFLLGLRHALDADHVAAVASLATRASSFRETLKVAGAWGLGHASILVFLAGVLVALDASVPDAVARGFEGLVGIMLVVLGVDVLRRLGKVRAAAPQAVPRAVLVGCLHGIAGTAGLLLLAVPASASWGGAVAYVMVFGAGTVLGMLLFSTLLSIPFTLSARRLRSAGVALEGLLGATNIVLGAWIAVHTVT